MANVNPDLSVAAETRVPSFSLKYIVPRSKLSILGAIYWRSAASEYILPFTTCTKNNLPKSKKATKKMIT